MWLSSSGSLSHFCDRNPLKVLCLIFMISILYGSLSLSSASSTSSLAYCDNLYFVPNHPSFDPQSLAPGHPFCYPHPLVPSLLNEIVILFFLFNLLVTVLSSSLYSLFYMITFVLLTVATFLWILPTFYRRRHVMARIFLCCRFPPVSVSWLFFSLHSVGKKITQSRTSPQLLILELICPILYIMIIINRTIIFFSKRAFRVNTQFFLQAYSPISYSHGLNTFNLYISVDTKALFSLFLKRLRGN